MKTVHRWLKLIFGVTAFMLLASCANYIPTDSTVGNMSVKQARKVMKTTRWRDGFSARVTSEKLILTHNSSQTIYRFSEFQDIQKFWDSFPGCHCTWVKSGDTKFWVNVRDAKYFANALYVLKRNAVNAKKISDEYEASFASSLAEYRNKVVSNTAPPEEANRYKVQAEGAVRDKQFDDAADLYAEALKIAPWWPVGHFNRALVLGETGDYGEAMREMKRYLQLVPDAPNARAAQDKIYNWERLDSQ